MVFLKLLLAHLITDFGFQTEYFVERKKTSNWWLLIHTVVFVGLSLLLFAPTIGKSHILVGIIALGAAHYLIDWIKTKYFSDRMTAFLLDQSAHIFLIGSVAVIVDKRVSFPAIFSKALQLLDSPRILIFLTSLVLATLVGSVLVGKMIQPFIEQIDSIEKEEKPGMKYAGTYIGILERLLILILILTNNFAAIGFVFAAKSLIRFPESKEKHHFAEYFLIGTMTSFTYAIIVGLVARYLIRYFH